MALSGSVLITIEVPELAFFLPSLRCQLQEDKATQGWGTILGNLSVITYDVRNSFPGILMNPI